MKKTNLKIIMIHGNGGATASHHWFPETRKFLEDLGLKVICETFPDNEAAHEAIWLPFLRKLGADENTIIIGHSSGAVAAMRYAETTKIFGSVLVGASQSDLGDKTERESGYFNRPWGWRAIRLNQNWIIQFASIDDPFIPIEEARFIRKQLKTEYYEFMDRGHFMSPSIPELLDELSNKLGHK
jgi:predicted alpha/beta hydrolase family esterase